MDPEIFRYKRLVDVITIIINTKLNYSGKHKLNPTDTIQYLGFSPLITKQFTKYMNTNQHHTIKSNVKQFTLKLFEVMKSKEK